MSPPRRNDAGTNDVGTGEGDGEPVNFVADARLISILGEQLIGSEKVGILELVKNAYDAGAEQCTVRLERVPGLDSSEPPREEYRNLPGPIIEISDDGAGMSHDDIINGWLRPATPRRAQVKAQLRRERENATEKGTLQVYNALVERLRKAHGGRLPLGEKGIGRLATHRLGRFLWLRTKTRKDPLEWELRIDWSKFDALGEKPLDLAAVKLTLRHQPPTGEYENGSGTILCCYGGRPGYRWTREQIVDVGRAISSLRSPKRAPERFEPRFESPHISEEELASPLERVRAPFELVAIVDERGKADVELRFKPPGLLREKLRPHKEEETTDLRTADSAHWKTGSGPELRAPTCGPFILHVRAWLRHREWLGPDYTDVTDYLEQFGGIGIYRDGLATLPAQQSAKIDWLGLAQAQIKKAANISYYHLSGEIEIQQETTLALQDRSSREGLIETQAYRDLALLTRAAVDQLQGFMQDVRGKWSATAAPKIPPKTLVSRAKDAALLSKTLVEQYDFAKDPLKLTKPLGGKSAAPERIEAAAEALQSLGEQLRLQDDERDGLLEAAGFGLAIGVAVHELAKLASAIVTDARQLRRTIGPHGDGSDTAESIRRRAEALLGEVRRLAPLRVTRAEGARAFGIRSAIEAGRTAFVRSLEDSKIVVHIERGDFRVKGRFGALAQVFANLLDNAIYWIGSEGIGGTIHINVSPSNRTVTIADSGPGIPKKMIDHLFEPFYSTKSPPSGLGLYICRHYLGQLDADIRRAREDEMLPVRGAQFVLDFSESPTGDS